jgi:hypothetical protein
MCLDCPCSKGDLGQPISLYQCHQQVRILKNCFIMEDNNNFQSLFYLLTRFCFLLSVANIKAYVPYRLNEKEILSTRVEHLAE